MNPQLSVFDFQEQPVRVIDREGSPWFVAADVCRVLEIANPSDALRSFDDDEKITLANTEGNPRAGIPHQMAVVSESGLYALVFKSRKPQAKAFRKWVTAEVLPAIRQSGGYALPISSESPSAPLATAKRLEAGAAALIENPITVPGYVREFRPNWGNTVVMAFGRRVRQTAKAVGIPYSSMQDPGWGILAAYPRNLCFWVDKMMADSPKPGDDEQFAALISGTPPGEHNLEEVMGRALDQGFFPDWLTGASLKDRSAKIKFGRLIARCKNQSFPGRSLSRRRTKRGIKITIKEAR